MQRPEFVIVAAFCAAAMSSRGLAAQRIGGAADRAAAPPPGRSALRMTAHETHERITIDGRLDEAAWKAATPVTGFVQSEPRTGEPATEPTEVRVLYDATTLYIGAYLHDREPGKVVVNDIRKDFQETDQDDFEVLLDTFHDRRNAYVFMTNAEGARADRQVANEGKEINASWDAVWTVKTQRTADGWTVEMAIPFRSLRYNFASAPEWGINFSRHVRRKNEVDYWALVPRAFTFARVSVAGDLAGLNHEGASRELRVKPYVAARTVRETGAAQFGSSADAGLDVKWGITQGLTFDATVNPDFAQVEADEQRVNLTQFSLFFPEKREFFLENSGIFYVGDAARNARVALTATPDEDLLLFYSRRIGLTAGGSPIDIPGGVRLTGQVAGFTIGTLSMDTKRVGGTPASNYSVLRVRRNLWPGTDIGFLAQSRQGIDTARSWNRVYGGDANIRFPGNVDWSSYAVGTRSPGVSDGQYAFRSSLSHEDNDFHWKFGALQLGEGFTDDMGYFRRTGVRKYLTDIGPRPRPEWARSLGIREMHPHIVWNYYQDLKGQMIAKNLHSGFTFFLENGAYIEFSDNPQFQRIDTAYAIDASISPIPPGSYGWNEWKITGSTDLSRAIAGSFTFIGGGLWSGTQRTQQVSVSLRPGYRFATTVGVSHTEATLSAPQASFEALLWTVRSSYSFTTNMFFDALAQYDPRGHLVNANLRFNVIHHPLSDLFIVFNEQRITTPDAPNAGRGVIVKFTQMLSI